MMPTTSYRYPTTNRRPAAVKARPYLPKNVADPEVITPVQGITPGSKEEWRVAQGLYILKEEFEYQKPVFGGRISGGQIIDFWVTSTMLPTPIYMNGTAWHNNVNRGIDEYKLSKLKKVYYGRIRLPLIIWDYEVPSVSAAVALLRRKL
jgi:hypothetical protein